MEILTLTELRKIRQYFEFYRSSKKLEEIVIASKQRSNHEGELTIFLSHSHDEYEVLKDAIALLNILGIRIYVDWMDIEMPKLTSAKTAQILKDKIVKNKKFIFLATEKAVKSQWCNWELGLGDAAKYSSRNIALLVIRDDNSNWTRNEYFQIYPIIVKVFSDNLEHFEVRYPDKQIVDLQYWITH